MLCKNCAFTEEEFQSIIVHRINKIIQAYESGTSANLCEELAILQKILSNTESQTGKVDANFQE